MIPFLDRLIKSRDWLLDKIFGIPKGHVLNPAPSPTQGKLSARHLSMDFKKAVNGFMAVSYDTIRNKVDYRKLRDSAAYDHYQKQCTPLLRSIDLTHLVEFEDRLAFWINLYNALVIDGVIAFQIRNSITEMRFGVASFFKKTAYNVGGYRFNCDDIEHGILRGNRGHPYMPGVQFSTSDPRQNFVLDVVDPRIHFALNCASQSCPPIGVYTPENIDNQLETAAHNFINANVKRNSKKDRLTISSIFKWYMYDFGGKKGVRDFLLHYLPHDDRRTWLGENPRTNLVYQSYDWSLNAK